MKRHLLILILALFIFPLKSQVVFSPPGAEWNYSFYIWPSSYSNYKISYIKDTLDGTDKIKQLQVKALYRSQNICTLGISAYFVYIKQKGDTVFFKHKRTTGWQILYNFAAGVGQFWTNTVLNENNSTMGFLYFVDSVSTIQDNGYILKKMVISMSYSAGIEKMTIVERYGNMGYLFNFDNFQCITDADHFERFLCYKDSVFPVKQFSSYPCNFTNALSIDENNQFYSQLNIFPNPSNNNLTIHFGDFLIGGQLQFSDAIGRVIKSQKVTARSMVFDISTLPNGIYILNFIKQGQIIESKKAVIDH